MSDIRKRLNAVMAGIGHVDKGGKNTFDNYSYQKWEDIAQEIRRALIANGVTMAVSCGVPIRESYENEKGKRMVSTIVPLKIRFMCEDGEESDEWFGESSDRSDKSLAKAITSGVKGYLLKRFLVPVEPEEGEHESDSPDNGTKEPAFEKMPAEILKQFESGLGRASTGENLAALGAWLEKRKGLLDASEYEAAMNALKEKTEAINGK